MEIIDLTKPNGFPMYFGMDRKEGKTFVSFCTLNCQKGQIVKLFKKLDKDKVVYQFFKIVKIVERRKPRGVWVTEFGKKTIFWKVEIELYEFLEENF